MIRRLSKNPMKKFGVVREMLFAERRKLRRLYSDPMTKFGLRTADLFTESYCIQRSFPSYAAARRAVRAAGIRSISEYLAARKDGRLKGLPCEPDKIYKSRGWVNWHEFFGNRKQVVMPFNEAKALMRSSSTESRTAYRKLRTKYPSLPGKPEVVYAREENWKGLFDFFGKKPIEYFGYRKAMRIARRLKIKSAQDYSKRLKAGLLPIGMPSAPDQKYSRSGEWNGWPQFLGERPAKAKKYRITIEEASRLAISLGIRNSRHYRELYVSGKLKGMPAWPPDYFGSQWTSWYHFLGKSMSDGRLIKERNRGNKIVNSRHKALRS